MKKLFSVTIMLFIIMGLTGCVEDAASSVTIYLDNEGEIVTNVLEFNDTYEGTLLQLIEESITVEYTESEYGKYLTAIGDLHPLEGSYIAFSKNGEPSMVSVEQAEFTNEDEFKFEISWYDMTSKAVYDGINLFLLNLAEDYVNDTYIDYNVATALGGLGVLEDYVTDTEVVQYVNGLPAVTVQDYYKIIMILNAADIDSESYISDLNDMVTPGSYGQTAYGIIALQNENSLVNVTDTISNLLAYYDTNTPYSEGLDTGAISLVALSTFEPSTEVTNLIDQYTEWIQEEQLDSGGIKTRDMVYGETTYPGTENAATISMVILGLLAVGENPNGADYLQGSNTLITRLLEFQTDTGSFDYLLTDDLIEDLQFSTPQAFLALVEYQLMLNES